MKAVLLLGTLVSTAMAAEPECVPGFWNCVAQDNSVEFVTGHTSALCQKENWIRRDGCFTRCPLKLTITEPAEYRMSVCLGEHAFKPYDTTQHLDLNHPLNNKELTVMAPPDGVSRMGCGSSAFVGANYTDALVVMNRGHCWFYEKFANAKVAGALAGVMVNTAPHGLTSQMRMGMGGSSADTANMQMGILPGHFGHIILEALDAGHTVKGMMSLTCGGDPPPVSASQLQEYTDCPHPSFRGVCDYDREKSLCNTCPLQMEYGDERVCLWGNDLQPRSNTTEFQGLHELPVTGVDTVLIDYLPNQGCLSSDFEGLQGAFVLLSEQGRCTSYQVARKARAAGVAGLAVLSSKTATDIVAVQGLSQFLQMPTHSVQPKDTNTLEHWFKEGNSPMNLAGATVAYRRAVNIVAGYELELNVPKRTPAPQLSAPLAAVGSRPELEFTAAVIVNLVLLGLLLIAIVVKVYHQRRRSVDVQLSGDAIRMPLAVALTSLCLSLLAAIAAVAFILAFQAGDRATDSAVEDGKQATKNTHANAVDNVDELARQLRQSAIAGVLSRLAAFLTEGQRLADAHSSVYFSYDGTWKAFNNRYSILVDITYKGGSPWYPKVFTEEGFYASETRLTDAFPDSSRGDGLAHVSITNNGWLYGFQEHWYDSQTRANIPFARGDLKVGEDPRYWLGGEYGDPFAVVRDRPAQYKRWYVSPVTFPHSNREVPDHKISVFTPIYSGVTYRGFVQADAGLYNLVNALSSSLNKGLQNMSAFIVDRSTELLLATNKYYTTYPTFVRPLLAGPSAIIALYNITECPPVEVIAAGYYLKSMSNTTGLVQKHTGEFDQRAHYADPSHKFSVLDIQADASGVRDSNADKFAVAMRGPCATRDGCLAVDPTTQRRVMRFEGSNTLQIYRNLTTNFPDVASSQVSAPGEPWQSSYGPFNRTLPLPGSSDRCVAMADERDNLRCMLQPLRMLGFGTQTTLEIRFNPDETVPVGDLSQTLFSDAERGEAFLKIMASGRLIIGVHSYVCRTKPLAEPLAGGQWHTLTAVVDRLRGLCYMYVNGKLHDVSTKTSDDTGTQSSKPWVAGRFYKGSVASIKGFRIALNAKEVLSLYEDGLFTRDVPERDWFVEVDTLLRNSTTTAGINWGVVAMIPRSDVMRTVDENNVMTLANLKIQEDNTRAKQKQELYEAGLSVIVIALFSVLVFLIFNTLLTEPIEALAVTLHDAAYLKLGEIPTGNSRILEVAIIASAAANMIVNLTEYRRYLPMHVKQDAQEQLEERCLSEDPKSHDGESESRNSQNSDSALSSGRGSRVFSFSRRASGPKVGDVRLSKKTVTTAVTNIYGFQQATDKSAVHCVVLTRFLALCATHRATADFTGDRFHCYWNAFKTLLDHRIRGLDLALKFHEVPMSDIRINTAICTGVCQVGNLGNDEMRKPSVVGSLLPIVNALERVGRFTENSIVVDRNLRETTALHIIRVYDYVCGAGLEKGVPLEVSVLEGAEAPPEEAEWMYQLEQCVNPYLDWNTLCHMVRTQDWEVCFIHLKLSAHTTQNATTLLESGEFEAARKTCPTMFTKYTTAVKDKKQPPPLEIGVHDSWGKAHKTTTRTRDEVCDNS